MIFDVMLLIIFLSLVLYGYGFRLGIIQIMVLIVLFGIYAIGLSFFKKDYGDILTILLILFSGISIYLFDKNKSEKE